MSREARHGVRLKTHFETLYCSDRQEGEAVLADVSYSGALLESATRPAMSASVMLYVCLPDSEKPVELRGKVVRHTADGFAVYYDKPNPDVVRFVDDEAVTASLFGEHMGMGPPTASFVEEIPEIEEIVVGIPIEDAPVEVAGVPAGAPMLLSELDLSPYSLAEIEALAKRIPGVIASRRLEAKQRVLERIKKLAEQAGFSLEELLEKP